MVSMKDIAAVCGVSVATVSKALSNHRDISEEKKKQIRETADKMGYHPNQSARYLKTNRSYNLGVFFEDAAGSGLTHDFFAGVLQGFKKAAEAKGYDVTFLNNNSSEMSYAERARYRGFDGVAIVCCLDYTEKKIVELLQSSLKVVTIDYIADNRTAILSNNTDGIRKIMEYLFLMGHTKIAYIHGDRNRVTRQRLASFYSCMEEKGLTVPEDYVLPALYRNVEQAYEQTNRLLALNDPPTCILYPDDVACFGGINAIKAKGLSVPNDISVVGYDGIMAAQYEEPRLTTFYQNVGLIGKLAAEKLIAEIDHPQTALPEIHTVDGYLLEGQTVRNMRKHRM